MGFGPLHWNFSIFKNNPRPNLTTKLTLCVPINTVPFEKTLVGDKPKKFY